MGFFDDVQSLANRGMASANRTASSAKLKMQQGDLMKQRKELASQLGASLYEATKNDPQLRQGRESVYDGIAAIDEQRAQIEAQIAQIEQEAQAQAQAALTYTCPTCGGSVRQSDSFCAGCGTPVAQIIEAAQAEAAAASAAGPHCVHCGAPISEGDVFCMSCGGKQDEPPAQAAPEEHPQA